MTELINSLLKINFFGFYKYLHYHRYCLKKYIDDIVTTYDTPGKKLIDIGAGRCQYKSKFKNVIYKSQDIVNNSNKSIDYVCDAGDIPVDNSSFDYILCTQALEHFNEPDLCFKEFNRILKEGGLLFLTTHQSFEEHMVPNDYFRYTRYGLKYLAGKNNFQVIKIEPEGGRFIFLAKYFTTAIPKILKNPYLELLYYIIFFLPLLSVNIIFYYLDYFDKDKLLTINYNCIFKKTASSR